MGRYCEDLDRVERDCLKLKHLLNQGSAENQAKVMSKINARLTKIIAQKKPISQFVREELKKIDLILIRRNQPAHFRLIYEHYQLMLEAETVNPEKIVELARQY